MRQQLPKKFPSRSVRLDTLTPSHPHTHTPTPAPSHPHTRTPSLPHTLTHSLSVRLDTERTADALANLPGHMWRYNWTALSGPLPDTFTPASPSSLRFLGCYAMQRSRVRQTADKKMILQLGSLLRAKVVSCANETLWLFNRDSATDGKTLHYRQTHHRCAIHVHPSKLLASISRFECTIAAEVTHALLAQLKYGTHRSPRVRLSHSPRDREDLATDESPLVRLLREHAENASTLDLSKLAWKQL